MQRGRIPPQQLVGSRYESPSDTNQWEVSQAPERAGNRNQEASPTAVRPESTEVSTDGARLRLIVSGHSVATDSEGPSGNVDTETTLDPAAKVTPPKRLPAPERERCQVAAGSSRAASSVSLSATGSGTRTPAHVARSPRPGRISMAGGWITTTRQRFVVAPVDGGGRDDQPSRRARSSRSAGVRRVDPAVRQRWTGIVRDGPAACRPQPHPNELVERS